MELPVHAEDSAGSAELRPRRRKIGVVFGAALTVALVLYLARGGALLG